MSEIVDGGPAFPCEQHETQNGEWNQTFGAGMSLRDWFAGQGISGVMAGAENLGHVAPDSLTESFDGAARILYQFADAMLKARVLPEEKL